MDGKSQTLYRTYQPCQKWFTYIGSLNPQNNSIPIYCYCPHFTGNWGTERRGEVSKAVSAKIVQTVSDKAGV